MDVKDITESRYNVIIDLLQRIAKREDVINPKIDIIKGCAKGDGYAGEKSIAIIKGDNKSLELFIKGAPTNPIFKKALDPRPIYLLEILFYEYIYPAFNEFQTRKRIPNPFTSVIHCMGTNSEEGNELIILQNARNLGYELWDRKKHMNSEHVEFVYKEYGKFHALSYALKDQEPRIFQSLLDKYPLEPFELMGKVILPGCTKLAEDIKSQFDPVKEEKEYNAYGAFIKSMPEFMESLVRPKDKHSIITHGDCWCSNMMFKYAINSNKVVPEKMCLIDFQAIGQAPSVVDLSYFLYASSPKEIYNNLDHYLKIYYDSLSNTVRDLGSSQDAIPTLVELKHQWKTFAKYGLIMTSIVNKACLQEEDETQELTEVLEENGADSDLMAGFTKKIKHDDVFYERMKSLIVHMVEHNFI